MSKEKSLEEQYQSIDEIGHVLLRPGMYIGNTRPETKAIHVINETGQFESKEIEFTPGVVKLIDEVLSNSIDEHVRCKGRRELAEPRQKKNVHMLTKVDVTVTESGKVIIEDNGGIPVQYHTVDKMYLPQMLFGKLRAGSNFDDTEQRTVVGTNGVGSSLANILSNEFQVTTCDGNVVYNQRWTGNMKQVHDPILTLQARRQYAPNSYPSKDVYTEYGTLTQRALKVTYNKVEVLPSKGTKIEFDIDFSRFPSEETISYGVMKLIERKCIMAAASNSELTVTFNGTPYHFENFSEYVKLYGFTDLIHGKVGQWEYVMAPTELFAGGYNYSLVNGAECNSGTHVSHFHGMARGHFDWFFEKKHKVKFTADQLQKQYALFLNVSVVNPVYDSQTKEKLVTENCYYDGGTDRSKWPKFENKTYGQLETSKVVTNLLQWWKDSQNTNASKELAKKNKEMQKKSPRSIAKLLDAGADLKNRNKCSLWIFEGQSAANTFADVRQPLTMGSYTLKGKVKNTLYLKPLDIAKNVELNDIAIATGLRYNREYVLEQLRFGKLIIAVDADIDGICICGQLITFFQTHFPEIIDAGMLYSVSSPLYKLTKGSGKTAISEYFYSQAEFEQADKRGKAIEYFKGLGSLGKEEYAEMVNNPRLTRFVNDSEATSAIDIWMGADSSKKKRMLEANEN